MSFSFNESCKLDILEVIGRQTVTQFVKTKSAIHHSPFKSSKLKSSSSWVVKEKSFTVLDMFVSIGNLLEQAPSNKLIVILIMNNLFIECFLSLYKLIIIRYHVLINDIYRLIKCIDFSTEAFYKHFCLFLMLKGKDLRLATSKI